MEWNLPRVPHFMAVHILGSLASESVAALVMFGTNLKIEQGLKVRKMASWLHYKPWNGAYLVESPTPWHCCDHCKDCSCEDGCWFEQHTFGLASTGRVQHKMIKTYRVGNNLNIEQGLKVRKMASWWLHYKPQNGAHLAFPTSKQCCDNGEDSCLPLVGHGDICV